MMKVSSTVSVDYAEYLDKSMKVISLRETNTDGAKKLISILSTTANLITTRNLMTKVPSGALVSLIHFSTKICLELKKK